MKEKMNVLFIITDAQRADHLDCAGLDDFGDIYDRKSDPLELNKSPNEKSKENCYYIIKINLENHYVKRREY